MKRLNLPKPISVNRLFRNAGRGRVKTKEYAAWHMDAWAMLQNQKPWGDIPVPCRILFTVGEVGIRKDADGDNMIKCLLDALVKSGVIPDDNRNVVRSVGMEWDAGTSGAIANISPA